MPANAPSTPVLTPGRYCAEAVKDDEAFADKMVKLTEKMGEQMAKRGAAAVIRQKLGVGLSSEWQQPLGPNC